MVLLGLFWIVVFLGIKGEHIFGFYNYRNWQTSQIDRCGTLKIPEEWVVYQEKGRIYVTDEKNNLVLIQTNDEDEEILFELLNSVTLSNSATYGEGFVEADGEKSENYYISLPARNENGEIDFIVWDTTINKRMVEKNTE